MDKRKIGHDLKKIATEMRRLSEALDSLFIDLFESDDQEVYYKEDNHEESRNNK